MQCICPWRELYLKDGTEEIYAGLSRCKIAPHSFQCIFFETGDLSLGDADHVGYLGLGLAFEKAQRDDMALSVVQTFHCFTEGEMFHPRLFLIFFVTDLVHDVECVATVGVDRLVEAHWILHGI